MELGNARILEVLYYSGKDDRNKDDFVNVTERAVKYEVDPEEIITIDPYGRVKTLKEGNV